MFASFNLKRAVHYIRFHIIPRIYVQITQPTHTSCKNSNSIFLNFIPPIISAFYQHRCCIFIFWYYFAQNWWNFYVKYKTFRFNVLYTRTIYTKILCDINRMFIYYIYFVDTTKTPLKLSWYCRYRRCMRARRIAFPVWHQTTRWRRYYSAFEFLTFSHSSYM